MLVVDPTVLPVSENTPAPTGVEDTPVVEDNPVLVVEEVQENTSPAPPASTGGYSY